MFHLRLIKDDSAIGFMKWRWFGMATCLKMAVVSLGMLIWAGLNYGVDFRGGVLLEVHSPQIIELAALRQSLEALNLGDSSLQTLQNPNQALIRLQRQPGDEQQQQLAAEEKHQSEAVVRGQPFLAHQEQPTPACKENKAADDHTDKQVPDNFLGYSKSDELMMELADNANHLPALKQLMSEIRMMTYTQLREQARTTLPERLPELETDGEEILRLQNEMIVSRTSPFIKYI